ncbi:MAG: DnaJ domain-containing protein [Oscillospiraceae bacterium]|nr:DnaJ domain-containing protein [Oscillospiraceae bacterium]MBR4656738.1 DnaJ domain-containing protein [Oscillospiraceae bacterium]
MKDPYEVLGVSRTASDSEIKSAYRELVKKYHPDNYANNPLADLASEKMKEINEAYDAITRARSGSGTGYQSSGSNQSGYQSYNSYSQSNASYVQVRSYINQNQLDAAESLLNTAANRDAEWYYLKGTIAYRRGWLDEARQNYQTAVAMVPGNYEYQNALRTVQGGYTPYRQNNYQRNEMDTACDICNTLLCLNCLCGGCR